MESGLTHHLLPSLSRGENNRTGLVKENRTGDFSLINHSYSGICHFIVFIFSISSHAWTMNLRLDSESRPMFLYMQRTPQKMKAALRQEQAEGTREGGQIPNMFLMSGGSFALV